MSQLDLVEKINLANSDRNASRIREFPEMRGGIQGDKLGRM